MNNCSVSTQSCLHEHRTDYRVGATGTWRIKRPRRHDHWSGCEAGTLVRENHNRHGLRRAARALSAAKRRSTRTLSVPNEHMMQELAMKHVPLQNTLSIEQSSIARTRPRVDRPESWLSLGMMRASLVIYGPATLVTHQVRRWSRTRPIVPWAPSRYR